MTKSITRLAPSPTGAMHLGTMRTGYINWLQARSTGGKFILRIDDTDIERNKKEWVRVILDSFEWLGLDYDELYFQSERIELYTEIANKLVKENRAFEASNGAIILSAPIELPNSFLDTIAGNIPITDTNREQINDRLVLTRGIDKGGTPTYQFASVCDDYSMGINHIIRGVDHITNTPKQIAIFNSLDFVGNLPDPCKDAMSLPQFTHLGLIFKDKKKLSKRDGAASLLWYKEQGYSPEAMLNWMLLLGWGLSVPRGSSKEEQKLANEPIPKAAAIELFQKGTLKNSPCNYDINKLNWLQKRYAR